VRPRSHSPISARVSRAFCTLPQARRKPCAIPWITSVWTGTPAAANLAAMASPSERRLSISGNTRSTGGRPFKSARNGAANGCSRSDGSCILLGGDSVGGNLALTVPLLLRDTDGPPIKGILSESFGAGGYGLTLEQMAFVWSHYVPHEIELPGVRLSIGHTQLPTPHSDRCPAR
jgi:hypothetical protein